MRSPAFLIISLVSTTLFNGSSASSMTASTSHNTAPATGIPQVGSVLSRSMEMIKKVNETLRIVQAGVKAENEAKVRQDIVDHTRNIRQLTEQLTEAVSNTTAQVTGQPAAQVRGNTAAPLSTTTVAPNTTTQQQRNSPAVSSQGSPSPSSGPIVMNPRLASYTSPKKLVSAFLDEGNGIEDDIVSVSSSSSNGKRKISESSGNQEVDVNAANKNARKETPITLVDIQNAYIPITSSSASASTRINVTNTVQPGTVVNNRLNIVPTDTIKERLAKRKEANKGSTPSTTVDIEPASSQPLKNLMTSALSSVKSTVSIQSVSVGQAVPKQIQPTSVVSTTPLQAANITPANSAVDELAALIGNPDAFMERFFELDNEQLNKPTSQGQTLFELAVRSNSLEVAELLLGANCFSTTFSTNDNVLVWVVQQRRTEMARRLMTHTTFHDQVSMFVLGAAKYDPTLLEFLRSHRR